LDHPGVVPVYGLGQGADGRPFIAMRFIEGRTLTSAIDDFHASRHASAADRRRELNRLLGHLVAACNTVAYAHSRGILHRDIKPDNIMIGRFNETLVVDWGLAVPITRDARARSSGEHTLHLSADSGGSASSRAAAGTVGYVSPEATREGQPDIDARSDVYSLGATLYHVLTGRRAIRGAPDTRVVAAIRAGDLPAPREVSPGVPRNLDAVCRTAMAAVPAARYATPLDLAADLEACIADEPVSVLRQTFVDRLRRGARSHRVAVAAALLGLAATAVVGLFSAIWLRQQAVRVQAANRDSLRLAASFAAQTVAGEIDVRWRILESLAGKAECARLLVAAAAEPDAKSWPELQAWLAARQGDYVDLNADSWFITDARGIQLARFPAGGSSIGGDFSGRDYFHGLGDEAPAGERPAPIRAPHISTSYVSTSDQRLKIAFTVPVWAADDPEHARSPVGVIGISAPAGGFRILHRGLSSGQVGVLVDVREVRGGGDRRPGEILHHPDLRAEQIKDIAGDEAPRAQYLDAAITARLQALRKVRAASFADQLDAAGTVPGIATVLEDFSGVLPGDRPGSWFVAFEPVIIAGRPPELRDPGLAVLVQQRAE
ncbi:MAG: serine/threonine protein kinase, partial [Planctomycetaceae bacterium]